MQAKIFNEAKIVVTPHGSSLANLIFIKPNCKIIEIDHGSNPPRSPFGYFAKKMGGKYFPFYTDNTTEEHWEDDMQVDIDKFMPFLDNVIEAK